MTPQHTDSYLAINTAPNSENRIHSEEGGKEYGFGAGLVPGIATFAYVCESLRHLCGEPWVDGGYIQMRYSSPVYDREKIEVELLSEASPDNTDLRGTFAVTNEKSVVCGSGNFADRDPGTYSGTRKQLPYEAPWPERKPLTGTSVAATEHFGSVDETPAQADMVEYLELLGVDPKYYVDRGIVQLGYLARMYALLLRANFERLGPSIHLGTEIQVLRPVQIGEPLSIRGKIDRLFRRNGQGIWAFEMAWVAADESPCVWAMHTGIYDVKKKSSA